MKEKDNFVWKAKFIFLKGIGLILGILGLIGLLLFVIGKTFIFISNTDTAKTFGEYFIQGLFLTGDLISWSFTTVIGCIVISLLLFVYFNSRWNKSLTYKQKNNLLDEEIFELFFYELGWLILSLIVGFFFYDIESSNKYVETIQALYWMIMILLIFGIIPYTSLIGILINPRKIYLETRWKELNKDIKNINSKIKKAKSKSKIALLTVEKTKLLKEKNKVKEEANK